MSRGNRPPGRASDGGSDVVEYRVATLEDAPLLAQLNQQLIEDEGHSKPMTAPELEERMRGGRWSY